MHGFLRHSLALAVGLAVCHLVVASQARRVVASQAHGVVAPQAGTGQQLAQSTLSASELEEMEALLRELGFDPGPVDGIVDQDTLAAIERYQDFASLPGEPQPSQGLLTELRGVAAAFAALRNDQAAEAQTAAETEDDAVAPSPETATEQPAPEASAPEEPPSGETLAPQEPSEPESPAAAIAEKVIVPPPPVPPKLKPLEALPEVAPEPEPPQLAARPPEPPATPPQPADPAARRQALVAAELAPYREALANGTVTRDGLAQRFNKEGRQLLEAANYAAALLKFDVAIQLNPRFAGAYSNRGTTYELMEERERAEKDFERARQLGFGGVRPRAVENPLR